MSAKPALLEQLLARRLLVLLGKGGVGKTVLGAALATVAAERGLRTLVMETDSRAPLACMYGLAPDYRPREIRANLAVMTLDGARALEEYLGMVVPGRAILHAVTASPLYQFFVQAAPGLRELMMLGKVLFEIERKVNDPAYHDLVMLDAPASGHALALLRMPAAARATFGDAVVGREARNIARLLHDRKRTALLEVTTSDPLAISETIELLDSLRAMDLGPTAILFNRVPDLRFGEGDAKDFVFAATGVAPVAEIVQLAEVARRGIAARARAKRAITLLRSRSKLELLEFGEHCGAASAQLVERLVAGLRLTLNSAVKNRPAIDA
ncbi:MAG TPA: ArsA-related P-loop ATPase [Candidatus Binataceae bacterium]|nr:ArsA-related P-loop ATPase [Candidatus Binataceae bacterium]